MKNYRTIILAIIALLIFVGAGVTLYKHLFPSVSTSTLKDLTKHDTVHHRIDQQGREHGKTQVQEADVNSLRLANPFMDSVLRANDILTKQVVSLNAIGTTTSGRVIVKHDTVMIEGKATPHFSYSDKWLQLDGTLGDTAIVNYSFADSLIVTTHTDRKWFLGKSTTYVDAYSLNPASHIKGLTGLKVATPKPKRFGIGPYVGYGWNGTQWQPSVGVALQYSPIRF